MSPQNTVITGFGIFWEYTSKRYKKKTIYWSKSLIKWIIYNPKSMWYYLYYYHWYRYKCPYIVPQDREAAGGHIYFGACIPLGKFQHAAVNRIIGNSIKYITYLIKTLNVSFKIHATIHSLTFKDTRIRYQRSVWYWY